MPALKIPADKMADVIPHYYFAGGTPYFSGRPGMAKTAMVRESAKVIATMLTTRLGAPIELTVRELHLASMSEVDVRGYLIPNGERAQFTRPEFWEAVEANPYGILFLDEFAQASHEVQKAVAPLLLERRIGEYQLPAGWMVVCAGNGLDDGAGANSLLTHVINRISYIEVGPPDIESWIGWAASEDLEFECIAFAKTCPGVLFESQIPDAPNTPYCTPRSIHLLSNLAKHYEGGLQRMVANPIGMAMIAGYIGDGAAAELAGLVRTTINLPTYAEVVADPAGTRIPDEVNTPSEAYCMVMLMAVRAKVEDREAVMTYLTRFKPNFAITGIVACLRRNKALGHAVAMLNWARANQDLLTKFREYITEGTASK